jgi:hypothetical protein
MVTKSRGSSSNFLNQVTQRRRMIDISKDKLHNIRDSPLDLGIVKQSLRP